MAKRVAVVLSGCGVYDGSEIYETVITLLRLDQAGAVVQCFAPDMQQLHVINHATGEVMEGEERNVLIEAARLARGNIQNLSDADAAEFDAVILPGGFGAAKNLSDFAVNGPDLTVIPSLVAFVQAMREANKPVGLMCIAPAMTGVLFGDGATCTIGNDSGVARAVEATGAIHKNCAVDEVCIDEANKLVTTPAYMLAGNIGEAAIGINKLVDAVLAMT